MGLYTDTIWPKVRDELVDICIQTGAFHGSILRDLVLHHYPNSGASLDSADIFLLECVEDGYFDLLNSSPRPTPLQAALAGLAYTNKGYQQTSWAAGTREHFAYCLAGTGGQSQ